MAKQKLNKTIIAGGGNMLVRFSYPNVFEPRAVQPGQPEKYNVMLLIDKQDKDTIKEFTDAVNELTKAALAQGMWGGVIPAAFRKPLHDGDTDPKRSQLPEYQGMLFVNATSKFKPGIVDRNNREIIDPDVFYPGCYGRAQLNLFPYDSMGNQGIGVGLNHVQKVKDGPNLSGRQNAGEVFKNFDNSKFADEDDDFEVAGAFQMR